jgi:hypothetical protein
MPEENSEGSQGWPKQPDTDNDLGIILDEALAVMATKDGKEEKMKLSTAAAEPTPTGKNKTSANDRLNGRTANLQTTESVQLMQSLERTLTNDAISASAAAVEAAVKAAQAMAIRIKPNTTPTPDSEGPQANNSSVFFQSIFNRRHDCNGKLDTSGCSSSSSSSISSRLPRRGAHRGTTRGRLGHASPPHSPREAKTAEVRLGTGGNAALLGAIPKLRKVPIQPTIPEEQDGTPQQEEQPLLHQQQQPTAMEEDGTEASARCYSASD